MIDEKELIEALKEHFDICEIDGRVMYSDHIITTDDYVALVNFINNQPKVRGWIPCSERMPDEHKSMFAKFKRTDIWDNNMFETMSDDVNVTVEFEDGTRKTMTMHTTDGKWKESFGIVKKNVVAWMPLPEPYKG